PEDIKVIVRTFSKSFKHTIIWQTFYDVELIGSNDPIIIDPGKLARRIADPMIFGDMSLIMMGSADDFLNFFVAGTAGVNAFVGDGIVNTDDNMYLEFSAPFSVNSTLQEGDNIGMILDARESIIPYLADSPDQAIQKLREKKWNDYQKIMPLVDKAHTLILKGKRTSPEFQDLAAELNKKAASFTPWLALRELI
ncbi:MAG TPA: spermidine synthase, partial [Nitrospirota bacterium]